MQPTQWLDTAEGRLWIAYWRGTQLLERKLDQQLRATAGMSHGEFEILYRLAAAPDGRLRMGTLARFLIAPKSRLTHQVGQLVGRGLVAREPHPGDGRGLDAVLTETGRQLFLFAVPAQIATVQAHLTSPLDPAEQLQLRKLMERLAVALEESEMAGTDP